MTDGCSANSSSDRTLYKKIVSRIGLSLLIHEFLMYAPLLIEEFLLEPFFERTLSPIAFNVVTSVYEGFFYLAAFMVPAILFYAMSRDLPTRPMPLSPKVPKEAPLWILCGMAVILCCAVINSIFVSAFDYYSFIDEIGGETGLNANYQIVLDFMGTALVPAICEEFLFRGMIQTNLMPFGRTTAIIGSAVLFGLMHENAGQFFYATCAGIVLGLIRDRTDSVFCGTLVHLFNNLSSGVEQTVLERFPEPYGDLALVFLEAAIMGAGIVSAVILILRHDKARTERDPFAHGVYGRSLPTAPGRVERELPAGDTFRLFWRPSIVVFGAVTVGSALLLIVEAIAFAWL